MVVNYSKCSELLFVFSLSILTTCLSLSGTHSWIKSSRADSGVKVWEFSNVSPSSGCYPEDGYGGSSQNVGETFTSCRCCLPEDNFVEFCGREKFRSCITQFQSITQIFLVNFRTLEIIKQDTQHILHSENRASWYVLVTKPTYILIPLASSQHNLYTIYLLLCAQCYTPDDGQRNCPKHVQFYSKNKFEKISTSRWIYYKKIPNAILESVIE